MGCTVSVGNPHTDPTGVEDCLPKPSAAHAPADPPEHFADSESRDGSDVPDHLPRYFSFLQGIGAGGATTQRDEAGVVGLTSAARALHTAPPSTTLPLDGFFFASGAPSSAGGAASAAATARGAASSCSS